MLPPGLTERKLAQGWLVTLWSSRTHSAVTVAHSQPALILPPPPKALLSSEPRAGTLQRPFDGVVEVQRGLHGEAGSEVDVADA